MGENTKIEWADHVFNPVLGCKWKHRGCDNCYAQEYFKRFNIVGKRRKTSKANWEGPLIWNQKVANIRQFFGDKGEFRPRVFASLCDPFEDWDGPIVDAKGERLRFGARGDYAPCYPGCPSLQPGWATMSDLRRDFFDLIDQTPNLDWLLATKRPENILRFWPLIPDGTDSGESDEEYLKNVWLLYSASDQKTLEAGIGHLLKCHDLAPVLGLSLEPLLGPVDLLPWLTRIGWVIVGAESGPKRRPFEIRWLSDLAGQCKAAGVPLFVKQDSAPKSGMQGRIPEHLWAIKQFPEVTR